MKTRKPYSINELCLVFVTRKTKTNAVRLAEILSRTPAAVDWLWRGFSWGGGVGPRPSVRLTRQVEEVTARHGAAAFGCCDTVAEAVQFTTPCDQVSGIEAA